MLRRHKRSGMHRFLAAFGSSARGLAGTFREEQAFRQELAFACVALPLGLWLGHDGVQRALLAAPVLLVLIVELLNSSIEAAIDRISFEHHGLSKRAKDYGSAAVMLALLMCAAVWITLTYRLFAG